MVRDRVHGGGTVSWTALFERAARFATTEDDVRSALERRRGEDPE